MIKRIYILFIYSLFLNCLHAQESAITLDWNIEVTEVEPYKYLLSFKANVPEDFAVLASDLSDGTIVSLTVHLPETACFKTSKALRAVAPAVVDDVISEALGTITYVYKNKIHLILELEQTQKNCIKFVKQGYLNYMLVHKGQTFYPPYDFDFKLRL